MIPPSPLCPSLSPPLAPAPNKTKSNLKKAASKSSSTPKRRKKVPPAKASPELTPESAVTGTSTVLKTNTFTFPPLPNGYCQVWRHFLQNGGHFSVSEAGPEKKLKVNNISLNKQHQVLAFVPPMLNADEDEDNAWRRGWKTRQVMFHDRIKLLRDEFGLAPPDLWESCLPSKSKDWCEFATLFFDDAFLENWR
jgi:hypothetical protein